MPGPPATNSEVQLNDLELVRAAASNGTKAAVASGNHSQATNPAPLDGTPSIQLVTALVPKVSGVIRVSVSGVWGTDIPAAVVLLQIFVDFAAVAGAPIFSIPSVSGSGHGAMTWLVTVPLDGDTHELSLHLENADLGNITADAFALAIVAEELTA